MRRGGIGERGMEGWEGGGFEGWRVIPPKSHLAQPSPQIPHRSHLDLDQAHRSRLNPTLLDQAHRSTFLKHLVTALDPTALDLTVLDPTVLDPTVLDPTVLDPIALDPWCRSSRSDPSPAPPRQPTPLGPRGSKGVWRSVGLALGSGPLAVGSGMGSAIPTTGSTPRRRSPLLCPPPLFPPPLFPPPLCPPPFMPCWAVYASIPRRLASWLALVG